MRDRDRDRRVTWTTFAILAMFVIHVSEVERVGKMIKKLQTERV